MFLHNVAEATKDGQMIFEIPKKSRQWILRRWMINLEESSVMAMYVGLVDLVAENPEEPWKIIINAARGD